MMTRGSWNMLPRIYFCKKKKSIHLIQTFKVKMIFSQHVRNIFFGRKLGYGGSIKTSQVDVWKCYLILLLTSICAFLHLWLCGSRIF